MRSEADAGRAAVPKDGKYLIKSAHTASRQKNRKQCSAIHKVSCVCKTNAIQDLVASVALFREIPEKHCFSLFSATIVSLFVCSCNYISSVFSSFSMHLLRTCLSWNL